MQTTGITRRIDELGRVVIPKEIRRNMRLAEGEEVEIFVDDGKVVMQKFSTVMNLKRFSDEIALNLAELTKGTVLVADLDEIVSSAGDRRRDYAGKTLMRQFEKLFAERTVRTLLREDTMAVTGDDTNLFVMQIVSPVIVAGDVRGGVILLCESEDGVGYKAKMTELSSKILGCLLE